jgi:DNA-binding MarR family transcriptional regulator
MVELSLSERGRNEIAATFQAHNAHEQLWSQGLTADERKTMIELLRKIMTRRMREGVKTRS